MARIGVLKLCAAVAATLVARIVALCWYGLAVVSLFFASACTIEMPNGVPSPHHTKVASVKAQITRSPNIIILLADDLGYGDLASYGHPTNHTPNLTALANQGQRWTNFYAAAPVCSPSRGALLTGQYPVRSGLYGKRIAVMFPNDEEGMDPAQETLAEALRSRGYATGMVGKWHLGDSPQAYPTRHGFDTWWGVPYSNDMDWVNAKTFDELIALSLAGRGAELAGELAARRAKYFSPQVEYWNVPLLTSLRAESGSYEDRLVERPIQQPTLTRRYTEQAQAFIHAHKAEPFLLYVPYTMPHTPLFASEAFAERSGNGRYADVVAELDWSVGQITSTLRTLGLEQDTLVVFSSDNGPWLTMGNHGGSAGLLNNGKGTTFEGGVRVPTIFSWPGTITPATITDMGSLLDLFQTVVALSGGTHNLQAQDSLDLSGVLRSEEPSPRREFAYYRAGELTAYRLGDYKLRLVSEGAYSQPPERTVHANPQLFHLGQDPSEKFDIASQQPTLVVQIQQAIAKHQASLSVAPPLFDRRILKLQEQLGAQR